MSLVRTALVGLVVLSTPPEGVAVADGVRVPVVVELFSSEGCSSCPPADRLLARLDRDQPVAGADIIALEMHVDYWNQLGWTDPFSSSAFTLRQRSHNHALGKSGVYTPQMVVDGRAELIGSDARGASLAIQQAAQLPHVSVKLTRRSPDMIAIEVGSPPEGARALLLTSERGLSTRVTAGENAGETLAHGPIVRSMRALGEVDTRGYSAQVAQPARPGTRVIVVVEGRDTLRVLGAATLDM